MLDEAAAWLGEAAPLEVRGMAFGTKLDSYGCYEAFPSNEFSPGQDVLLYAEVENFSPESTAKGFHTSLRSSCSIFDSVGRRVDNHDFTTTEEYCRNRRRDYFIGYHLRLPDHLSPGSYMLKLTVEDLRSKKVGESSIDFSIKKAG